MRLALVQDVVLTKFFAFSGFNFIHNFDIYIDGTD